MTSLLSIRKCVARDLLKAYLDNGWTLGPAYDTAPDGFYCYKTVETLTGRDDNTECVFRAPYLIQIGRIRRPLSEYKNERLTAAVDMEYMGASEFEFGALYRSLRRVQAQLPFYKQHTLDSLAVTDDTELKTLRVFGNFDSLNTLAQYESWLTSLYNNQLYLKERSGFSARERQEHFLNSLTKYRRGNYDFWWDIKNDVFFGFDKNFMNSLPKTLQNSFDYMQAGISK